MKTYLKKFSILAISILLLVSLVACANDTNGNGEGTEPPVKEEENKNVETTHYISIEDGFGNTVKFEEAPERIISLAPSNTEILYALGLGDKIVGVSAFCDYPQEALEVEKNGDFLGTNFERILELEPDLIVSYGLPEDAAMQIYNDAGIPVISFMPESIDEVIVAIKQIAIATDTVEAGNDLVENMEKHRDEIVAKIQDTEPVRAFYEIWHDPLMAAGTGSFTDGLIKLANGINVASDAEGEYPNYDLEQLIENDPEFYLTANMETGGFAENTVESISARPGYDNISAVKNGDVYLIDGNVISRPGPRIVEGLELIARILHPEVFE